MFTVVILVFILTLLVVGITAALGVVYVKLSHLRRSQEYSDSRSDLVTSLSLGSIEWRIGFDNSSSPTRRTHSVDVPAACVTTATSFYSLESMKGTDDGINHRRVGFSGTQSQHQIDFCVDTAQVDIGSNDNMTPFDCAADGSDSDNLRILADGSTEAHLPAMDFLPKETLVNEPNASALLTVSRLISSVDIALAPTKSTVEEDDITENHISRHDGPSGFLMTWHYAALLHSRSGDRLSGIHIVGDQKLSSEELARTQLSIVEEDACLGEEDTTAYFESLLLDLPNPDQDASDERSLGHSAYLVAPSRSSIAASLCTVEDVAESSEDHNFDNFGDNSSGINSSDGFSSDYEMSSFDNSAYHSDSSSASTIPTPVSSPVPSPLCAYSHFLPDIIEPFDLLTTSFSDTIVFHKSKLAEDYNIKEGKVVLITADHDYLDTHVHDHYNNHAHDHIHDHCHDLSHKIYDDPTHDLAHDLDHDPCHEFSHDLDNDLHHDYYYDDHYDLHRDHCGYSPSHPHHRLTCSRRYKHGIPLDAIAEDEDDGDAHLSDSEVETLESIPDDISPSPTTNPMCTSASTSHVLPHSATASDSKANTHAHPSFGNPLMHRPSCRGTWFPRPLYLASRVGLG